MCHIYKYSIVDLYFYLDIFNIPLLCEAITFWSTAAWFFNSISPPLFQFFLYVCMCTNALHKTLIASQAGMEIPLSVLQEFK